MLSIACQAENFEFGVDKLNFLCYIELYKMQIMYGFGGFMAFKSGYIFDCDDCFYRRWYSSIDLARSGGWAISRDRKKCYCPDCAIRHRSVGCLGVK